MTKKILLGLGAAAAVIAPLATVVACGDSKPTIKPKTNVQTNNNNAGNNDAGRAPNVNGVLAADFTIPADMTTITKEYFSHITLNDNFVIPATVAGADPSAFVNVVYTRAFKIKDFHTLAIMREGGATDHASTKIKLADTFVIPNGTTEIPAHMFRNTILPSGFTVPATVTKIGPEAFKKATLPVGFEILNKNATLGKLSFEEIDWVDGFVIKNIETLLQYRQAAFYPGHGKRFKLGNRFKITQSFWNNTIPNAMFSHVDLKSATLQMPNRITSIGNDCFRGAILPDDFQLPTSLISIGSRAFAGVVFKTKIKFPQSSQLATIGSMAFLQAHFEAGVDNKPTTGGNIQSDIFKDAVFPSTP